MEAYLALMSGIRSQAERWRRFDKAARRPIRLEPDLGRDIEQAALPYAEPGRYDDVQEAVDSAERGRGEIWQTSVDPDTWPPDRLGGDLTP